MILLAIDPSISSTGAAFFSNGELFGARRVRDTDACGNGARVQNIASDPLWRSRAIDVVVYEWPKVYTASKSKGDPSDLLLTVAVGAAITAAVSPRTVVTYLPSEWIGQLRKTLPAPNARGQRLPRKGEAWSTPRGKYIARMLTPVELGVANAAGAADCHDIVDAIGIGLYHLGRLRRVYPGST